MLQMMAPVSRSNKAQVFEMFFTGQSRIADSHRSLGLGLALCRTILIAHGGTLTLGITFPRAAYSLLNFPKAR